MDPTCPAVFVELGALPSFGSLRATGVALSRLPRHRTQLDENCSGASQRRSRFVRAWDGDFLRGARAAALAALAARAAVGARAGALGALVGFATAGRVFCEEAGETRGVLETTGRTLAEAGGARKGGEGS